MKNAGIVCIMGIVGMAVFAAPANPPAGATPVPENLPPLLVTSAGEKVATVRQWEDVRRPEILRTFQEQQFGVRPVERPASLTFTPTFSPSALVATPSRIIFFTSLSSFLTRERKLSASVFLCLSETTVQ